MFKNKKGFTLIEFIIVMAIIGILVLMAAPKFMDYIRDAKLTQIKNDTRVVEDVLLTEQAKSLTEDKDIDQYLIEDKTQDKGISSDSEDLVNNNIEGVQIDPEFIKEHANTKLDPEQFYFDKDHNKVFYYYNKAKDNIKDKDNNETPNKAEPNKADDPEIEIPEKQQKALEKYDISKNGNEITVNGFRSNYTGSKDNIDDIVDLEINGDKIVKISNDAFKNSYFTGEFPQLNNLEVIGSNAFFNSNFKEKVESGEINGLEGKALNNISDVDIEKIKEYVEKIDDSIKVIEAYKKEVDINKISDDKLKEEYIEQLKVYEKIEREWIHEKGRDNVLNAIDVMEFLIQVEENPNIKDIGDLRILYEAKYPKKHIKSSMEINERIRVLEKEFDIINVYGYFLPYMSSLTYIGKNAFYNTNIRVPNEYLGWDGYSIWEK